MSDGPVASRPSHIVEPARVPGLEGLLSLSVGVVAITALSLGREVLIPITLAVLLSFVLAPLVRLLRRARIGRTGSVLLAVVVALGVLTGLGIVIGSQVAELATDLPRYASTIERKVQTVRAETLGRMAALSGRLGQGLEQAGNTVAETPGVTSVPDDGAPKPVPVEVREPAASPLDTARTVLEPIVHPLATTAIVLIIAVFILLQQEDLRDRVIRLLGSGDLHRTTGAMDEAARRLSRYFLTQLALNAAFGVAMGFGLYLIGVPNAALWGIITGLLKFVPYVGALLSAALPAAMAAAVDPGWSMVIWTVVLYLVAEPVMGQIVEPLVYGHSTGLSPFAVVVAAIFWTWLWGPVGLILAMPLTLFLVVMGRHIDRLEFIDVLLGDRPALTSVESFYQRMLAGDGDEVLAQAEVVLKERSLSSYYDEVALKALQLAANDVARGVVTRDQLVRIQAVLSDVVEDLADHDDVEPEPSKAAKKRAAKEAAEDATAGILPEVQAPKPDSMAGALAPGWAEPSAVLCVGARGMLDEAASAMVAQLLGKHGLGARVVPEEQVARHAVSRLEVAGTRIVVVSYLEAAGSPSSLRYLVRRLRQRLPQARILIGLWQADEATLKDERLRAAVGADHYVTTVREAMAYCMAAAREQPVTAIPAAA